MNHRFFTQTSAVALFLVVFMVTACDSSSALLETDGTTSANLTTSVAQLSDELQLSASQAESLDEVVAKQGDNDPGTLWYMAAELQTTLTDAQKTDLLAGINTDSDAIRETRGVRRNRRAGPPARGAAQERFQGRENAPAFLDDLTEEQQAQMKELRDSHRAAMKALMEQRRAGELTDEEMQAAVKNLRDSMQASLGAFLNEEQLEQLNEAQETRASRRQEFRERNAGNRAGNGSENRGNRSRGAFRERAEQVRGNIEDARREALGLTDEQVTQLEAARATQKEKAEAIFEELKASDGDREAVRDKMEALREEYQTAMNEILTAEQLEVIEIHRALAFNVAKNRTGEKSAGRRGNRRFNRSNR